jgi:acyl carrier protein
MELDQILTKYPQLTKITEQVIKDIFLEKFGFEIDFNLTYEENGFDDLDCIEFAMEIEKRLDITIWDEVVELLFDNKKKPPRFTEYWRNKKLDDLGI